LIIPIEIIVIGVLPALALAEQDIIMAKKNAKTKIIPPFIIGDKAHPWGGLNTVTQDPRFLERGESYDSINWITGTQKDNIQLRRGKQVLGKTNRNGNPVTGLGVGTLSNKKQVPFFTYDRKIMIYDSVADDTVEVNTPDILPVAAKGENVNIIPYSNLAGSFVYLTSPNSSQYKIPVANPKDVVDQLIATYRFAFERTYQSRMFAVGRQGNTKDSFDKTGVYLSWTDRQTLADYPAATTQGALFTGDGATKTFSGTLTVPPKQTIFYISITTGAASETFFDDGNGNLTSNLGGTGTINYATGAFTVNFFTAPIPGDVGPATFNTEDATTNGICDFSFNPASRVPFSGELLRQDDGGGKAQAVFPFNGVQYCFHILKTWQLTLAIDDKTFSNLPYYEQIGIPSPQSAFPKGSGILFLDNSNPGEPTLSILKVSVAGNNLTIVPEKLSIDFLDLTEFGFDACVVFNWGDYDIVCCAKLTNGILDKFNSVMLIRDIVSGLWNRLDYFVNFLAVYNGSLIAGDSLSPNLYTLFSGFDDDGDIIPNNWNNAYTDFEIPGMKKVGYFNIQGLIQPSQKVKVSYSLDSGVYIDVFTIDGTASYVSKSTPIGIGSFTIGENVIGGDGGGVATANPFEIDIPVHSDLFEFISFRLEALDVGFVQINKFSYKDIRFKRRRIQQYSDPEIDN
jgi:hypothetical protein